MTLLPIMPIIGRAPAHSLLFVHLAAEYAHRLAARCLKLNHDVMLPGKSI